MLKRSITYPDFFTDEEITEDFYFNVTESEFFEFELEFAGGMEEFIKTIIRTEDLKELVKLFKRLILLSVGEKQGSAFVKSPEFATAFSQTSAYNTLFMELATDDKKGAEFINGITPKTFKQEAQQDKPLGPPPTPTNSLAAPVAPVVL